jgi:hypothetical protein
MTLSTCLCCVERSAAKTLDVAVIFRSFLRANHEEDKLPCMRDDLSALLGRDQGNIPGWDCLGYPVQFLVESNNNTARPRLIYNMMFP